MFSYHSNGKLQPATIWNLNHLFSLPAPTRKQWHNCTTKEDKQCRSVGRGRGGPGPPNKNFPEEHSPGLPKTSWLWRSWWAPPIILTLLRHWQIKRKKSVEEKPFSLFQDLSPLLVASFRLASFRNVKCGKCGFLVISVAFVKSISDIFFSVLHTACLSSIKNNRDCWTI